MSEIKVGVRIIRRRPDGTAYRQLRWTVEGVEDTRSIGWTTEDQADLEVERQRSALLLGVSLKPPSPSPVVVSSLCVAYLDAVERRKMGSERYRRMLSYRVAYLIRHLGDANAHALTRDMLAEYVAIRRQELGGRGNRPPRKATVQSELRSLRCILDGAAPWPGLPSLSGWPDDATPPRRVTPTEVEKLLAAKPSPQLARLIRFASWCPRRPVAIFALTRADCGRVLDDAYGGNDLVFFSEDKGGRARGWGPLLPQARAALREHLRASIGPAGDLVWTAPRGGHGTAESFGAQLRALSERAKIPAVRPYDLRKLACVRAYEATGRSLPATTRFTGHRDAATLLKHYLFAEEELVSRAVTGGRQSNTDADNDAGTPPEKQP